MSGPTIDRANSSGDIWTPQIFITAVEKKFGPLYADLACTHANMKAPRGLCQDEGTDALNINWWDYLRGHRGWLNPPYSNITPWARKCAVESQLGARILLLVPGSIGANWYWQYVKPFADVYSVGRMVFDNCFDKQGQLVTTPYPKDLMLADYRERIPPYSHMERWRWKENQ